MATADDLLNELGGPLNVEGAKSLIAKGTTVLTIDHTGIEELGKEKEKTVVVYFVEIKPCIPVNKSRGNQLKSLFGSDALEGQKVKLSVGKAGSYHGDQIIFGGVE